MFQGYETSAYLTSLYNIVTSFRYQRQPYVELRVLVEGDAESEATLKSMLVVDNLNTSYPMDFQKFLGTVTGGGGGSNLGAGGPTSTGAYY